MPSRRARVIGRSLLAAVVLLGSGVTQVDAAVSRSYQLEPASEFGTQMTSPSFTLTVSDGTNGSAPLTSTNYQMLVEDPTPVGSAPSSTTPTIDATSGAGASSARSASGRMHPAKRSQTRLPTPSPATRAGTGVPPPKTGTRTPPDAVQGEAVTRRMQPSAGSRVPLGPMRRATPALLAAGAAGYAAASVIGPRAIATSTARMSTWLIGSTAAAAMRGRGKRRVRKARR